LNEKKDINIRLQRGQKERKNRTTISVSALTSYNFANSIQKQDF